MVIPFYSFKHYNVFMQMPRFGRGSLRAIIIGHFMNGGELKDFYYDFYFLKNAQICL